MTKPETRFRHLAKDVMRLARHFERERPSVRCIRLYRDDWNFLRRQSTPQQRELARAHGFEICETGMKYRKFDLLPDVTQEKRPSDRTALVNANSGSGGAALPAAGRDSSLDSGCAVSGEGCADATGGACASVNPGQAREG